MTNKRTDYEPAERPPSSNHRFLTVLRTVTLVIAVVSALGSVVLTILAGRSTPRFLLVLFIIWVVSPFAGMIYANILSKRWPVPTQIVLACVTLLIACASLAVYSKLIPPPAGSPNAFVFVAFPPVSWLFGGVPVLAAALFSRKRSH